MLVPFIIANTTTMCPQNSKRNCCTNGKRCVPGGRTVFKWLPNHFQCRNTYGTSANLCLPFGSHVKAKYIPPTLLCSCPWEPKQLRVSSKAIPNKHSSPQQPPLLSNTLSWSPALQMFLAGCPTTHNIGYVAWHGLC